MNYNILGFIISILIVIFIVVLVKTQVLRLVYYAIKSIPKWAKIITFLSSLICVLAFLRNGDKVVFCVENCFENNNCVEKWL